MMNRLFYFVLTFIITGNIHSGRTQTTAQLLGFNSNDRVLIINADDFGMCHSENVATMDLLLYGSISSATIMTPCSWFSEAAEFCKNNPQADVGIHLTLTSEWKRYKWGSVASTDLVPSLLTYEGYFPEATLYVELWAKPDEVEVELRAQIEKALQFGIVPTHIDNHMATVYGLFTGHDFLDSVFKLSKEYGLPFRLPRNLPDYYSEQLSHEVINKLMEMADSLIAEGFVLPDYLHSINYGNTYDETFANYRDFLINLKPGVTELYIHAAKESDEIKAITNAWRNRDFDYRIFMANEMKDLIDSLDIHLIGWRDLQVLQREQIVTKVISKESFKPPLRVVRNFPNPFNSATVIQYHLPLKGNVSLTIFDISGREVKKIIRNNQPAGYHQVFWHGANNSGDLLSSGLYLCKIQADGVSKTIKLSFIK
jgi:chitin disaccharide deacetylase